MFVINEEDNSIYITRGDVAFFSVSSETDDGEAFKFHPGDVVRFKVYGKKNCGNVVLSKDFGIEEETEEALIYLEEKDTKIGNVISKPVDYWYEVELNPYTDPQTIIGYDDEDGAKIFRLFPEGAEAEDDVPITPEEIPVVDEELDLTSTRPVQNQAIARAITSIKADVRAELKTHSEEVDKSFNEAIEEQKTVFNDALAKIVMEDITEEFVIETRCCSINSVKVWKLGNIISGHISFMEILESGHHKEVDINPKYAPLHRLIVMGETHPYPLEDSCVLSMDEMSSLMNIEADAPNYADFSFTYICAE